MHRGRQQYPNMPPTGQMGGQLPPATSQQYNMNHDAGGVRFKDQPPHHQQQQPQQRPLSQNMDQLQPKNMQPPLQSTAKRPPSFHDNVDGNVLNAFDNARVENLRRNTLYEDPDFPANDRSVYFSRKSQQKFEWLRPNEIVKQYHSGLKPELFVGATNRFDLNQGKLGDCWVVATLASLSENMEHIYNIIPRGQSFRAQWYAGIFRFRFWQYGRWIEVIIDDRLPTIRGELMFVHSNAINEFWAALIEKAYAKLYGSYEALKSGHIADALTDLTGGLTETYILGKNHLVPKNIVNIMFKALERQSVIGASIYPLDPKLNKESLLQNGLVAGHAYSVTDMREIRLISDRGEIPITLIRIRNPWGSRIEWNGPWSDRSPEWNSIPDPDKRAMGLVFRDDGEFWMDFRDFLTHFSSLDVCNLSPQTNTMAARQWEESVHFNRWTKGITTGGRPACRETHWMNPQYRVMLSDSDDDEDQLCSLLVELSQKDRRRMKHKNIKALDIGFVIYEFDNKQTLPLNQRFFEMNQFKERCDHFIDSRHSTKRFLLPPGEYIIVPSTYEANESGDFMLRLFFEKTHSQPSMAIDSAMDSLEAPDIQPERDPELKLREEFFKKFFYDVAGENMEVDVFSFQQILNGALGSDSTHKDLDTELCKALIALVDTDDSCQLGYNEFIHVWNLLRSWRQLFYKFDKDKNGSIRSIELRNVLHTYGYKLNSSILAKLVFGYSDSHDLIELNRFIACMTRLGILFRIYRKNQKNDYIAMGLEQWLQEGASL